MQTAAEILGTRYPIIQGGMAQISMAPLAAAVSEAGCLGVIASASLNPEETRREIRRARELTDKPFAVNVPVHSPFADDIMAVVIEEKPTFVITAAGDPSRFMTPLKEAGIKVISVVASPKQARKMESLGADLVVAEGHESGGHVGLLTTMALIPQVVEAITIPVIAAGGIATGRGMAAAMQLGASGVQMGTYFMAATESTMHDNCRAAIVEAKAEDTVVVGARAKSAVRCLKNTLTKEYEKLDSLAVDMDAYAKLRNEAMAKAVVDGDIENGSLSLGQIAGLVRKIKPAAELVADIVADYNSVINKLPTL